ncbi:MBOAT family O-acyltransferase [Lichenicoccus sp.]|uniref:MBOAT family O-acyltransferase n=1 Tax=Lichenicoccus sp. TaxID=2781899 RepID=UPI003D0D74A0
MLFNSYIFIAGFLPAALLGYYLSAALDRRLARVWLVLCSLTFYAWWNASFVLLLAGSITFNYGLSRLIDRVGDDRPGDQKLMLAIGVVVNLSLLFFYKYLFAVAVFFGLSHALPFGLSRGIILPLGISFFTFTQLGYVVDSSQGQVKQHGVLDYVLFVTFFPHLIAGPILHNREIIPQFAKPETYRFRLENLAVGLSIFAIGLGKKVLIADPLGRGADAGFADPHVLTSYGAWQAVLSYTLQLYFDFSGYSDMAIGIARMFGIIFPLNFNSPYKSGSVIDFWQRWHMTLTRYLTLYLFNPVAFAITRWRMAHGLGTGRRAARSLGGFSSMMLLPLFFTMTLIGIWHGAGLQFVIFGLLHATFLSINHAWRIFAPKNRAPRRRASRAALAVASIGLTLAAVVLAQIFFRAASPAAAVSMIKGMLGLHPVISGRLTMPPPLFAKVRRVALWLGHPQLVALAHHTTELKRWLRIGTGFGIAWFLPNTQQIMVAFGPALESVKPFSVRAIQWRPNIRWGLLIAALLLFSLCRLENPSRFLYFQF